MNNTEKFKNWANSNKSENPFKVFAASVGILIALAVFWIVITFVPFYALASFLTWCFGWAIDFKFIVGMYVLAALVIWLSRK